MLQNIILIRHGQTEKDKSNPNRKLTEKGKVQILEACKQISVSIPEIENDLEIFTSDTGRTIKSSILVSQYFNVKSVIKFSNMRVENINTWIENTAGFGDITAKYFKAFKNNDLPNEVLNPELVAEHFLKDLKDTLKKTKNLIIIGHGSALEAFAYFQNKYSPLTKFVKELDYGEWLLLKRNG